MNHQTKDSDILHVLGEHVVLQRYPRDKTGTLRAWDSADKYLIETVVKEVTAEVTELGKVLVIHDNFGAITLGMLKHKTFCETVSYGDSWMSRHAIQQNSSLNEISKHVDFISDLSELRARNWLPDIIIGRVPKSKSQLAFLLSTLREYVKDDCRLYLCGMDKHLSKGQYDLLEQFFGRAKFYPGVKKARIWSAQVDKSLRESFQTADPVSIPGFNLTLSALPNVFCSDKLDIGSRFFLEHFSKIPSKKRVADLACGSGVLGLSYLSCYPEAHMSFFDESFQAIQSTQENLIQLTEVADAPEQQADFVVGDGLKSAHDHSFELILCNPPFHQQNAINKEIANSFFKDAKRCLVQDGELWVVANRNLGYHIVLKRLFQMVETVAGNNKFVILRACKQS